MWTFLLVSGKDKIVLGEILSLALIVSNKWTQPIDALISISASEDYQFVQVERDQASQTKSVQGEHQVIV